MSGIETEEFNEKFIDSISRLAEHMPGGFFMYHADDKQEFIMVNTQVLKIAGCSNLEEFKQLTNNSFHGFVHPEEVTEIEKSIANQIIYSEEGLDYVEYRILRKDGAVRWIRDYGHFAHTETYGDIFYVFIVDCTDNHLDFQTKKQIAAFSRTDAILHALTIDYICLIDVDVDVEKEVRYIIQDRKISQWSTSDDFTSSIEAYARQFIVPEDQQRFIEATRLQKLKDFLELNEEFVIEYKTNINGSIRHFQGRFTLNKDAYDTPHIFIGIRDLTDAEHIRFEEKKKLEMAKKEAEEANKVKTTFLFNMSHDIRTPMNAIMGFTNLLEKNLDNKEVCIDYIHKIQHSSGILLGLINNVLEMARIENGKAAVEEKEISVSELNGRLFPVFEMQAKEKNIEFKTSVKLKHDYIWADSLKVEQILLNLLGNAFKYTPAGGKVECSMTELPSLMPGFMLIKSEISDTGIGIAEEFLPHIYDSFSRERNTTESRIEGSGLGLSIVKKYVDLLKGTIEVESVPRKGTKFTVILPHRIADEKENDVELSEEEKNSNLAAISGKKVLLAEDNDLNAEIAEEILKSFNVETIRAKNGLECVEYLSFNHAQDIDAVLMDIQMPTLNGYEAASVIRASDDKYIAGIPIIAMTANAFEEDRQQAIKAGMNAHVAKPINVDQLVSVLASVMKK